MKIIIRSFLLVLLIVCKSFGATETAKFDCVRDPGSVMDTSGNPAKEYDGFKNLKETTFTFIEDVLFKAPYDGEPCEVNAKISFDGSDTEARITSVKLIYSINGGTEIAIDMKTTGNDIWMAHIPAQDSGNRVNFYIRIADSCGNVSTGAISSASELVEGEPDADDSDDVVPSKADLLNISANYDDEYIYINFEVQGEIDGGTMHPPYLMVYGIKITNPDTDVGEGLKIGKLWIFIPIFLTEEYKERRSHIIESPISSPDDPRNKRKKGVEYLDKTGTGVLDLETLTKGSIAESILFEVKPEAEVKGRWFSGKVRREALGRNPSGYLRFVALTAGNKSLDSFNPFPLNGSNFLTLYTSSYSFVVK